MKVKFQTNSIIKPQVNLQNQAQPNFTANFKIKNQTDTFTKSNITFGKTQNKHSGKYVYDATRNR